MAAYSTQRPRHSGAHNQNRKVREKANKTATDLAALPSLSHAELKSRWIDAFGTAPPKGLSRRLLICALAYEIQTKDQGRLKPETRKRLLQIGSSDSLMHSKETYQLTTGTRLMREWRGTVHVVDVTKDGLVWNGRVYASLSAIARTITGTRWSGQRFFGLRKRSDAAGSPKADQTASPDRANPRPSDSGKVEETTMPDSRSQVVLEPVS